jgi:hypothetical protein
VRYSMLALIGWVFIASGLLGCGAALTKLVAGEVWKLTPLDAPQEERDKAQRRIENALTVAVNAGVGGMTSFTLGCGLLIWNWRQKRLEARRSRSVKSVLKLQEQDDG